MKNFNYKLLLASTAILSAAAITANAVDLTVSVPVKITFIDEISVDKTQDLDFGKVGLWDYGSHTQGTISISSAGAVSGTLQYLGGAKVGRVVFDGAADGTVGGGLSLSFPDSVDLQDINSEDICGTVSDFSQTFVDSGINFGATFTKNKDYMVDTRVDTGQVCNGTVTATVIYSGS